jgi:hypothetical protein
MPSDTSTIRAFELVEIGNCSKDDDDDMIDGGGWMVGWMDSVRPARPGSRLATRTLYVLSVG